jgi:hypothetical protein
MTLQKFKDSVEVRDQIHVNRSTDGCSFYFKDIELFHNRTYWNSQIPSVRASPAQHYRFIISQPRDSYWTNTVFKDLSLAKSVADKEGATVEMCFYCDEDDPAWFLIFDDLDKALEHCYNQLKKQKTI